MNLNHKPLGMNAVRLVLNFGAPREDTARANCGVDAKSDSYPYFHPIIASRFPSAFAAALALIFATAGGMAADAPVPSVRQAVLPLHAASDLMRDKVEPFVSKHCQSCHRKDKSKGELDLTRYATERDVTADFRRWKNIADFIRNGEMPPEGEPQPSIDERQAVLSAIEDIMLTEAKRNAGDPGTVLPRRLSSTEYDLSIRALTGVDIRATAEFPADPAGGEGFDNTGEALGMTPNLLNKYLGAAQFVSEHLVLRPEGVAFAPFPVTSYSKRKKLTEEAIIDFYRQHDVSINDYVVSAWRYKHRNETDRALSPEAWAQRQGLSGSYVALVVKTLAEATAGESFMRKLGGMWEALPAPTNATDVPQAVREVTAFIALMQTGVGSHDPALIRSGRAPIDHLAMRVKVAASRDKGGVGNIGTRSKLRIGRLPAPPKVAKAAQAEVTTLYLRLDPAFDSKPGLVILHRPMLSKRDGPSNDKQAKEDEVETLRAVLERETPELASQLAFGKHPSGEALDPDSLVLQAPFVLTIPLGAQAMAGLQGKYLHLDFEVDAGSSAESAVFLQQAIGKKPDALAAIAESLVPSTGVEILLRPESQLAKDLATAAVPFCKAFPNRFLFTDANRGLTAGFHLVEGFFRDDQPLMEKVLTDAERAELDRLWKALDFVTKSVETMFRGFVWYERAERHVLQDQRFDFLRSEDPLLMKPELMAKFERHYLEKLGVKLVPDAIQPEKPNPQFDLIHGFFERVRADLTGHERTLEQAEAPALRDVERLAERAFCRPLRADESKSLRTLYQQLREQGEDVEGSLRGMLSAVLMSPDFFYRSPEAPEGGGVQPLAQTALAQRLSYFLWSSPPDEELLAAARSGKLQDEAELQAQTRRMLKDPRIEYFAREFFGQWLRYRDYLSKDPIPPGAFAGYDAPLRQAMFEEPTRLITHLLQQDQPVGELLHGDSTFVNAALAKFYGGDIERQFNSNDGKGSPSDWRRVEGLSGMGRGGLLGMPVILAKNSAGSRTSPVKRGFWVVHHLLGQHFPPPPADVPELPKTEKEASKTIRELLADHTANSQCAICHVHFDGLGLTMEGFDAVGRSRNKDLAGRAIQATGPMPGGGQAEGIAGLIDYIEHRRQSDFQHNFSRKLLGYALGRSVTLSDQPLLADMEKKLQSGQGFSVLFETVVLSPQFRQQRGRDFVASAP